jgi:hypothetical protein
MKITAYNHHARLLSSRASWSFSRNQFTQVEGADAVMQSSIRSFIADGWDSTNLDRPFSDPAGGRVPHPSAVLSRMGGTAQTSTVHSPIRPGAGCPMYDSVGFVKALFGAFGFKKSIG